MQSGYGSNQRGAVLPLMAICLAVLMGFAGMAIDIGFLEYQQQVQQAATDAAALGGAQTSYKNSCASSADDTVKAAAQYDAALNGFTDGVGNVTVSVTPGPSTGVFANNACAVDVTISKTNVQTFFSRALGFFGMKETTHAVGLAPSGGSTGCVWLLLPGNSQTSNFSNATFSAPGCSIYINSAGSANMSNATINAGYIGYNGQAPNEGGATFSSATPKPMSPSATDPCSTISGCSYLTNHKTSIEAQSCGSGSYGSNSSVGNSNGTPTCFSSLQLQGSNITVCGLIEIVGGQLQMSGGTVVNSCSAGVTFFMGSSTNTVNVSGGSHLTLSAPTSGNTAGVLFWRDPSQSNSVNFSSAVYSFSGLIYFPTADVTYSAGSSGYTELVFGSANFSAGATLATPGPGASGTSEVTLAQ